MLCSERTRTIKGITCQWEFVRLGVVKIFIRSRTVHKEDMREFYKVKCIFHSLHADISVYFIVFQRDNKSSPLYFFDNMPWTYFAWGES